MHPAVGSTEITATIIFIIVQFFSAVMLYRYWEMILYNYDDVTESSASVRNTLTSRTSETGSPGGGTGNSNRIDFTSTSMSGARANQQLCTALTDASHMQDSSAANAPTDTLKMQHVV